MLKQPQRRATRLSVAAWNPPDFKWLPNPHPALLAHELLDVVRTTGTASCRPTGFPAAKGIDTRPGARCRSGAAISICDSGLNSIEEVGDFAFVLRKNS